MDKTIRDIELVLGLMDIKLCLLEDKSIVSSDDSSSETKVKLEKWERSNLLSLILVKRSISNTIRDGMPSCEIVKGSLNVTGQI